MEARPDAELIDRSRAQPELFELILDRHHHAVRRFAQRLCGIDGGMELAARTFEVGFDRRASFDDARYTTARPWLIGISLEIYQALPDKLRRSASVQIETELATFHLALSLIDEQDRDTYLLFALADLEPAEVAQILAIPTETVHERISRAREVLREQLELEDDLRRALGSLEA